MQITININGGEVEVSQPEQVGPNDFRSDMNVKKAIEDLTEAYLDEAERRCGNGHGSQTAMSKLLGFPSYQAFAYWLKRREKRAVSR